MMRIKLCAIAKDESAYLFNWVFHHLYFGFDEVEVWLNNITDNSEELCREMARISSQFKYRVADDVVSEAYRRGKMFQIIAYEKKYKARSEEHTSELQSRGHLVCRLLLEKKNSTTACVSKSKMIT